MFVTKNLLASPFCSQKATGERPRDILALGVDLLDDGGDGDDGGDSDGDGAYGNSGGDCNGDSDVGGDGQGNSDCVDYRDSALLRS